MSPALEFQKVGNYVTAMATDSAMTALSVATTFTVICTSLLH